jgi:pimeloyl-ACP methyl ester carboxylesterase
VVAGNSLGGCMALRAAQDDSLPISGVVPVAPAGLDMATWIRVIEGAPLARGLLASPVPVPEAVVRQSVARLYRLFAFAHPRKVDPGVVRAFTSHIRTRRDARRILATGRRVAAELADPFELAKVRCPVLIVWGDRDRMVYSRGAQRVIDTVPGTRLELIEDCGHCPQIEEPDRIAELLTDFLAEVTAPPKVAARPAS